MFETIVIKSNNWVAEISPELGANVTKLQYENMDVLIPLLTFVENGDVAFMNEKDWVPNCSATVCNYQDGKFSFEGRNYSLPITEENTGANLHGLLHREIFDVVEVSEDSATLFYKNENKIYEN